MASSEAERIVEMTIKIPVILIWAVLVPTYFVFVWHFVGWDSVAPAIGGFCLGGLFVIGVTEKEKGKK